MRVLVAVGTRPEIVKMAPVIRACQTRGLELLLVHTGQHYSPGMAAIFYEQLGLPLPDIDLGVGSGRHAQQTAAILTRMEEVILEHRPDAVLVEGDINSVLAAGLASAQSGVRAHDAVIGGTAPRWGTADVHHCPSNCHPRDIQEFDDVQSGSFTAPDQEYPSHLELKLTVTDSGSLTDTESVLLQPNTVDLTFQSLPSGLSLGLNAATATAPITQTVIVGSNNSLIAPTPQSLGGQSYAFVSWSDGGAATHNIVAPAVSTTYTATYEASGGGQTSTFTASADTYLGNPSPNKNYGTENLVKVREGTSVSPTTWRSFLRFDVSGLTGPVSSVKLRLFCADFSTDGGSVFAIGGGWSETGMTWNNAPAIPAGALGSAGTVNRGAYVEITLDPSAVSGDGTYDFALKSNVTNNAYYQSREGANPPQLVITTGP